MTTIIPFRSTTLPAAEVSAILDGLPAALPGVAVEGGKGAPVTMTDPATLALFVTAGATIVAGLVQAIATVWAARIAARQSAQPAAPPAVYVIVVETNHTTVRVAVDPADPTAAVAATPLPTALSDVTGIRLEQR